jgi:hypothetical protein
MKRINHIFWIIFCAGLFGLTVNAQTKENALPSADPRVAKALKEANLPFEIASHDGSYKVTYGTKDNRRQTAIIASMTEDVDGVEMRAVLSFAMISDKPPSLQTAILLLEENLSIVSGWSLLKTDKHYAIVLRIYVPADLSGKHLDNTLQTVVMLADAMEEQLTKKDDH